MSTTARPSQLRPIASSNVPSPNPALALIADAVVEQLAPRIEAWLSELLADAVEPEPALAEPLGLVDAATLAQLLGVARSWVYDHATLLEAIPLDPEGKRPRLRFDVARAKAAMARDASGRSQPDESPVAAEQAEQAPRRRKRRLPNGVPNGGHLLVSRGPEDES